MITVERVTSMVQCVSRPSPDIYWQVQGDTRLTLKPSVIPISNYVIMVRDWKCLNICSCFLYCNHQVHRDVLIVLYIYTPEIIVHWITPKHHANTRISELKKTNFWAAYSYNLSVKMHHLKNLTVFSAREKYFEIDFLSIPSVLRQSFLGVLMLWQMTEWMWIFTWPGKWNSIR
jgi:hypothetical protein